MILYFSIKKHFIIRIYFVSVLQLINCECKHDDCEDDESGYIIIAVFDIYIFLFACDSLL